MVSKVVKIENMKLAEATIKDLGNILKSEYDSEFSKNDLEIDNIAHKMPVFLAEVVDDLSPEKITDVKIDSSTESYDLSFTLPEQNIDGSVRNSAEKLTYDVYWKDCLLDYTESQSLKELTSKPPLQILKSHVGIQNPCFVVIAVDQHNNPVQGSVEREKLLS